MPNPIGDLLAADEAFTHQVAETFATVGTGDPAWTETVCAMAMAIVSGPWPELGLPDEGWM